MRKLLTCFQRHFGELQLTFVDFKFLSIFLGNVQKPEASSSSQQLSGLTLDGETGEDDLIGALPPVPTGDVDSVDGQAERILDAALTSPLPEADLTFFDPCHVGCRESECERVTSKLNQERREALGHGTQVAYEALLSNKNRNPPDAN